MTPLTWLRLRWRKPSPHLAGPRDRLPPTLLSKPETMKAEKTGAPEGP